MNVNLSSLSQLWEYWTWGMSASVVLNSETSICETPVSFWRKLNHQSLWQISTGSDWWEPRCLYWLTWTARGCSEKELLTVSVGNVGSNWEALSHEASALSRCSAIYVTPSTVALGIHDKVDVCSSSPQGSRRRNKCRHCHPCTPARKWHIELGVPCSA